MNCLTKYGTWRRDHNKGRRSHKIMKCETEGLVMINARWIVDTRSIKFYDTNGKYTGFRLKSLK